MRPVEERKDTLQAFLYLLRVGESLGLVGEVGERVLLELERRDLFVGSAVDLVLRLGLLRLCAKLLKSYGVVVVALVGSVVSLDEIGLGT